MAITNSLIESSQKTVVFDATGENAITCMILCNSSLTTAATVRVWAVPGGQAAGNKHIIINEVNLPGGETFSMDTERLILVDGDTIQAQASQNTIVAMTVSYVQTAG